MTLKPVQLEKRKVQREENGEGLMPLRKGNNIPGIMYIVSEMSAKHYHLIIPYNNFLSLFVSTANVPT